MHRGSSPTLLQITPRCGALQCPGIPPRVRATMDHAGTRVMINRRDLIRSTAGVSATLFAPSVLRAADYPTGPIRCVCPFPPGSGADTRIRFYGSKLAAKCGQPIIVENKPG